MLPDERSGPGQGRPDTTTTGASVADRCDIERSRRSRRWATRELDALFLHEPPSTITATDVLAPGRDATCLGHHAGPHDYWGACTGMNLGVPERRRLGLEILARERAA